MHGYVVGFWARSAMLTPREAISVRTAGMGSHHSARSKTDVWLTPPYILDALGPFDLDPCSPIDRPWDTANRHLTVFDNGLKIPWHGRVWLNPPYGPQIGQWLARLADHGDGIALIFARTETAAWFDHIWPSATAIRFIKGRLNFHFPSGTRSPTNSGAPSALIAYGNDNVECLSRIDGVTVNLRWNAAPRA